MADRKDKTKSRLRDAMIQLITEKSFDDITTTELVRVADISRSGFYKLYKDKRDMIDEYQTALFNTIEYIFDKNQDLLQKTMLETYELLYTHDIYAALFSKNGSKESQQFMQNQLRLILDRAVSQDEALSEIDDNLTAAYVSTYYANAIFGLTQTWIERKRKETPQQIASLLMAIINK